MLTAIKPESTVDFQVVEYNPDSLLVSSGRLAIGELAISVAASHQQYRNGFSEIVA
jgi:hypothetical protein